MALEVEIEDRVVTWAQKNGFLTPKVKFAERGWPDRLFISPYGHTLFIEFKRPGTDPYKDEPLQVYRIGQLHARGIPAAFCDDYFVAVRMLQACLEPEELPGASNQTSVKSSVRSALPRPRSGQDVNSPSNAEDFNCEGAYQEDTNSGSTEASLQSVAGRDKEVGGIQRINVPDPTRPGEGLEVEAGSGPVSDKP